MINLSTPNEELLKEIQEDEIKAEYWLKKKIGGEWKLEELGRYLYYKAKVSNKIEFSDSIEYISPKGNRWFCGISVGSISGNAYPFVQLNMFVYYETYGSIGAFIPTVSLGANLKSCVIFTSHFFYQFCERAKIAFRSREMIMAFNRLLPVMTFKIVKDRGKKEILCRLPGGIGFGVPRSEDTSVVEIRTYLTDPELNGRQGRVSEDLRKRSDDKTDEFLELALGANVIDIEKAFKAMNLMCKNNLIKEGYKESQAVNVSSVLSIVYCVFVSVGYAGRVDFQQQREHFKINAKVVHEALLNPDLTDDQLFEMLFTACAKNLKIEDFDLEICMKNLHDSVDKIKKKKNLQV